MRYVKTIASKLDATLKYIFKTEDNLIVEFSYINKDDGKDIICISCQTMCNIGCKFCHTTDYIGKIKLRNLSVYEMYEGVLYIYKNQDLESKNRTLLVSFMGCGEPILNVKEVVDTMHSIKNSIEMRTPLTRFAVATCLPKNNWVSFFEMTERIKDLKLQVKLHLSLHYTIDIIRKEWMPRSLDIMSSLSAVDFYKKVTGNAVEIHYALLEGVNDTEQDAILMANFLKDKDINVKFLFYNEKDSLSVKASSKEKLKNFKTYFNTYGIDHEYYIPPGLDIGASCGQFLMDYYLEESKKTSGG